MKQMLNLTNQSTIRICLQKEAPQIFQTFRIIWKEELTQIEKVRE